MYFSQLTTLVTMHVYVRAKCPVCWCVCGKLCNQQKYSSNSSFYGKYDITTQKLQSSSSVEICYLNDSPLVQREFL